MNSQEMNPDVEEDLDPRELVIPSAVTQRLVEERIGYSDDQA